MKQTITFDLNITLDTLQDYKYTNKVHFKAVEKTIEALKNGKDVLISGEYSDSGWCLIFVTVDGKEMQLTKKQVKTSELKYWFNCRY